MSDHVDRDTLALLALGEPVEDARAHVDGCGTCGETVAAFAHVRAVATSLEPADRSPPAPPPHVWAAIEREVDADAARPGTAAPVSLTAARARRGRMAAALAAAAMLAIGVFAGSQLWRAPAAEVVADTPLEPLVEVAAGAARLVRDGDALLLEVDAPDLPPPDGFYALWMIDEDVAGMVSLGPLEPGRRYRLPDGLDPAGYPIVDVSIQPFDGDPTHSGNSVLRGQLPVRS